MQRIYSPVYIFLLSALRFWPPRNSAGWQRHQRYCLSTPFADVHVMTRRNACLMVYLRALFHYHCVPRCPCTIRLATKLRSQNRASFSAPSWGLLCHMREPGSLNRGAAIVNQLVEKVLVNTETNLQVATPFFSWLRTSQFSSVTLRMLRQYLNRLVTNSYLVITMHNHLQILFHAL